MRRVTARSLRLAEQARASGRTDLELVYLWNALEEARTSDDRATIERVRARAHELQASGVEEAGALVRAAETALAADGEGERVGAPPVEADRREHRRALPTPLALMAALIILVIQVSAWVVLGRLLVERSDRPFERPPVQVVANGRGHARPQTIHADGLYLTPADRTPARVLVRIARSTHRRYGVPTTVLRRIRSERQTLDPDRHQLDGIALVGELQRASPASSPRAVVIAITHADLFSSEAPGDRFAFGVRDSDSYAVISTARMDPRNYGQAADPALLELRLEKMILRYFGELYYGLPRSGNEGSLLRESIRSLGDIDEMTREFCPERPGALASC